jgi:hypothetical protein
VGEIKNGNEMLFGKSEGKRPLGRIMLMWRIILREILKK